MRSLHVITSDARRGAETFALGLAEALETTDHRARVVALAPTSDPRAIEVPVLGPSRRSPATLAALRRAARSADVVVAHGSSTLEASALALAGTGVPFVYRSIGHPQHWVTDPLRRRSVGAMLRRAERVTALWSEAADLISRTHGVPRGRIDVIPNGVSEARFAPADAADRVRSRRSLGVPADRTCLAFVGALSPEKDPGAAIEVVAAIDGAMLLVVGAGVLETGLREAADRLAPGRVRFLGQLEEPRAVYAAADLVLMPSRSEGMPAVPIEAGLVGTATVATPVGAIPSVIEDGVTGYLSETVEVTSFVRRVAEALPTSASAGRQAGAAYRGRYAMAEVAKLWRRTLEEVVAR
jgi:glycosyltransferase involved in cell wall biosynthesis